MSYRLVDTEIWDDEYIGDLEPEAKLVWLCLLTNDKANITGLYRITFKAIADMTGLDRARVEQIMARFDGAGKALYRDGWVFVVNYQEHQMRKVNGKIKAHIAKYLDTVPDGYLKEAYGYRYPIDTLSIPNDEIGNRKKEIGNKLDGGDEYSGRETQTAAAPFTELNASPSQAARWEQEQSYLMSFENRTGDYIRNNERAREWLFEIVGRYGPERALSDEVLTYAAHNKPSHGGALKAMNFYLGQKASGNGRAPLASRDIKTEVIEL